MHRRYSRPKPDIGGCLLRKIIKALGVETICNQRNYYLCKANSNHIDTMKKFLLTMLALVGLVVVLPGCSKGDEPTPKIIADGITITTPKDVRIGVGQLVIASTDVKSSKDGLSYMWKDQHGFTSKKDTLSWFPTNEGEQQITLTLTQNGVSKTLSKRINVEKCDFRLCFWGQPMTEIVVNELAHTAYYQKKVNEPITSELPEFIAFKDTENPDLLYAYALDKQLKSIGGIENYSISHSVDASDLSGYNVYLQDYDNIKADLIQKYGQPITDKTNYKYDFTDKNPKYLGYNIVFGSCSLEATFLSKNSNITLQMKSGRKYGTATINVIYKKK